MSQQCKVTQDKECPFGETLTRIESKLDYLDVKLVRGNGSPSVIVEVDRLKIAHKRQVALFNWFAGLASGALALILADIVGRHYK